MSYYIEITFDLILMSYACFMYVYDGNKRIFSGYFLWLLETVLFQTVTAEPGNVQPEASDGRRYMKETTASEELRTRNTFKQALA